MTSERRRVANQENAKRSTGPKTAAGKARSRRNALKHGLTGNGVVLSRPDQEALKTRLEEMNGHLQPVDVLERILVKRIALATVRLEKCTRKESAEDARRQRKALNRWDMKQLAVVEETLGCFEDDPVECFRDLTSTSFGCDWLMAEWQELDEQLIAQNDWTYEQAIHAFRLFGQEPKLPIDQLEGPAVDLWRHALHLGTAQGADREATIQAMQAIIAAERVRLQALRDRLWTEQDGPSRAEVEDCAAIDTSERGTRLQRNETATEVAMHRNLNRLIHLRKIEPEHQSVERWHKTGKLKLRRWDGISYAPTNPYYFSSGPPTEQGSPAASEGVGGSGMEESQKAAQEPIPTAARARVTEQGPVSAENEAMKMSPTQGQPCTSGEASHGAETGSGAAPGASWTGSKSPQSPQTPPKFGPQTRIEPAG
ncbi:MAG TPA: hypothetical protein VGZ22_05340 [Isosphaeraceae bacterium]|jgi:hypothetical protein|nr:hypothetical protein [Isosphaeraceae bacterium]